MRQSEKSFLVILAFIIQLTSMVACGQESLDEDDAVTALLHGKATQFLERVSLNETEIAYFDLLGGSELSRRSEEIEKLVQRTREIESKYGKYRNFERIGARRIGSDLVILKYLYKCENFPIVWYLTYYRDFKRADTAPANGNWVVISVRFDTRLEALGD